MVTESQILIDYIPIFLTVFGIVFFFLYLKTKSDKEAFEYSYNMAREELTIKNIKIEELRREIKKSQEDYSKAKSKIKKLNRKLENMNAEHIISSSTTDNVDSSNKTQYSQSDTYNGVSRYKMKKFINDHRTSKFASSMPSNSELDSLDIVSLYMYYTLLDNVLSDTEDNKDSSNTTTSDNDSGSITYPINEDTETSETTNSESEPSFIDKAAETINDITSPITTPVMGVVNEAFDVRDKMIDTTFGTLNEINDAKNEAIMNAVSPVIDKAEEIRDSVIDGVSNTVEKIKEDALELNHSIDNIEEISSDSESKSTYEDYESSSSSLSSDSSDYSSSSSSSDNDDSYSSSSSYWDSDSSSDYSSSSSSYDSGSSWGSSSSWDSGSSSFDSGSSGGDW